MNLPGIDLLAVPLGYILWFIYHYIRNYFISIFLFTLVVRAAIFPLFLRSQKAQADRARLAPRLERIQKKYAKDTKKLQEKQMALYEKEGVSITAGCLPMLVPMIVLFGIIAVIYSPLTHLAHVPTAVVNASLSAVAQQTDENGNEIDDSTKLPAKNRTGYYKELHLLMVVDKNEQEILDSINALSEDERENVSAEEYYNEMLSIRNDFNFFGGTLLENPWNQNGFAGINILWLIPLFSCLTALASSLVSMKFMNMAGTGQKQPGQGCSNASLMIMMPLFSLWITFTVPGGVGIYWICSNIIAVVQTIIMNQIYNPVKIRAQAEIEYEESRKRRMEDKKRLAEARARENAEFNKNEKMEKEQSEKTANPQKQPAPSKNPNKMKRRENGALEQDNQKNSLSDLTESGNESETSDDEETDE